MKHREALLRTAERRRIDAAFAAGFARVPEDDAELRGAMRLAIEAIEDAPLGPLAAGPLVVGRGEVWWGETPEEKGPPVPRAPRLPESLTL